MTWSMKHMTWSMQLMTWSMQLMTWSMKHMTWSMQLMTWSMQLMTWSMQLMTWSMQLMTWSIQLLTWIDATYVEQLKTKKYFRYVQYKKDIGWKRNSKHEIFMCMWIYTDSSWIMTYVPLYRQNTPKNIPSAFPLSTRVILGMTLTYIQQALFLEFWRVWSHPFIVITPRFTLTQNDRVLSIGQMFRSHLWVK